jgi:hypothetical protein
VADLAQEVVQEAQRERMAGLAVDDARVRAVEARAGQAEAALHAAQAGWPSARRPLTTPRPEPTRGSGAADERNHLADARDQAADERDRAADEQVESQTRKTEQRLPGHAAAAACPRPVPRTVLLAVRPCHVGCVPTLQRALDPRAARRDGTTHRYSTSSRATSAQAVC